MKSLVKNLTRYAGVVAVVALANFGSAQAQTLFWDGGNSNIAGNGDGTSSGASGTWDNTLQNWDSGVSPHVAWTGGYDAVFAMTNIASGAGVVLLGAPITANSLAVLSPNYVFGDNGSGNTLAVNTVSNTAATTISNNVVNASSFVKEGASTLIVLGDSSGLTAPVTVNVGILRFGSSGVGGPAGPQLFGNVTVASNATFQLFANSAKSYSQNITGAGSLTVQANSFSTQVDLVGNSDYTGNTTINAVTTVATSISDTGPCSIGNGTNITIGTGASTTTLRYSGPDATTTRKITLSGSGSAGAQLESSIYGALTWRGDVIVGASVTSPRIFALRGTSTLANEFAGRISDGVTNIRVTKADAGSWLLTGSNAFSGGLTINTGNLIITNDSALGVLTGSVTFIPATSSTLMGNLKSVSNDVVLAASRIFYMGFTNAGGGFGTIGSSSLDVASYLTSTGSVQRVQGGSGAVRFSNNTNDYTGDFSVQAGVTEFTSVDNQGVASSLGKGKVATGGKISLSTINSSSTLRYVGTNNSSTTRPLDWQNSQGLTLDVTNTGTVSYLATGNLKSGAASGTLTLRGSTSGNNTLAQVINDNGGVTSLSKSGSGKWVLTASNTFSGPVTITGGTLSVSQDANLGTSPGVATPNTINLASGALSASASFTLDVNRGIALCPTGTNETGSGTLEVAAAQTLTYTGIIADRTSTNSGSLIKTGAGTLTLSGPNTYTGDTTISAGTLALTGSGTLGTGTNIAVGSGATLDVNGIAGLTLAASQVLQATNGATATLAGNVNATAAALVIGYTNGIPTINVTGGALTLAAGTLTAVNVQNGGTVLPGGSYKLVSASGGGLVAGVAPTALTVTGDVTNTATLSLTGGELYLTVPSSALYPPTLGGITKSGSDVIVSFSGTNGQTYQVLTSTNVTLPLASWTSVASGTFSGAPVSYTNSPASEDQRFFIITSP